MIRSEANARDEIPGFWGLATRRGLLTEWIVYRRKEEALTAARPGKRGRAEAGLAFPKQFRARIERASPRDARPFNACRCIIHRAYAERALYHATRGQRTTRA